MSRIGNTPIQIPDGTTVDIAGDAIVVRGPKGELRAQLSGGISITKEESILRIERRRNDRQSRAMHGLLRSIIANNIHGVSKGWEKTLELHGVGYRAQVSGRNLVLHVGFSHPVSITPPEGITFDVKDGRISVSGADKQQVGQIAADVRAVKKPEPYKGKGIRYEGEYVRKKAGKAAKAVGA